MVDAGRWLENVGELANVGRLLNLCWRFAASSLLHVLYFHSVNIVEFPYVLLVHHFEFMKNILNHSY